MTRQLRAGCRANALAIASADEYRKDSKELTLKKNSLTLLTISACAASAMLASGASAAIATYSSFSFWQQDVVASGSTVATETFNSYNDGFYASPLTGSTDGISWSATATNGLFVQGGLFSTNNPVAATFTFAPGVMSVGANIFGTNNSFISLPARITVTLADGSSYIASTSGPTDFVGFISNGAAISSLTMAASDTAPGDIYVTADNMYFGVPAPGSLALLASAGLSATRRRRS